MNAPKKTNSRRTLSPAEVAARYGVSTQTIRRRIHDGTLPATRVGKLLRVDPSDLDRLERPHLPSDPR